MNTLRQFTVTVELDRIVIRVTLEKYIRVGQKHEDILPRVTPLAFNGKMELIFIYFSDYFVSHSI
jgi:hypothetical protein